jgi:hypothetical protein
MHGQNHIKPRNIVCFRYTTTNTLHKCDEDDDDDDHHHLPQQQQQ